MAKQPISIRVTSKEVLNFFVEQKSEGKEISYRSAAIKLMPKGVKWFESGADWDFAFWLEKLLLVCKQRGNHVAATYTFKTGKAKF